MNTTFIFTKPAKAAARCVYVLASLLALFLYTTAYAQDLPGASKTSYGVSPSGAFQFSLPVVVPVGINGVQPNLSIGFSSGGGNGPLGVGWGVSGLGAISRCGKTFATNQIKVGVQHNADDRFCLNGQQLILVGGNFGANLSQYRTESDRFAKITAHGSGSINVNGGSAPSYWEVVSKNGTITEYGNNPSAAFMLPGTSSIHQWKTSKVSDRYDNDYLVSYSTVDGYPDTVIYAGNKSVQFNYETRPDVRTRYMVGTQITIDRRLNSIVVKNGTTEVRRYDFTFETGPVSQRSRLASITECGLNNTCMPAIDIDWKSETKGFDSASSASDKAPYIMHTFHTYLPVGATENKITEINHGTWADVNGDGRADQVIAVKLPNGSQVIETHIQTDTGWEDIHTQWELPKPLRNYDETITDKNKFLPREINQGQLVDVNGDGLVDVVYAYQHLHDTPVNETWINNGNGWDEDPNYDLPLYLYDYTINNGFDASSEQQFVETITGKLVDINGDGLVDWVGAYFDYISGGNGTEHKATYLNTGTGWSLDSNYVMPDVFAEYNKANKLGHGQLVDVNGDGLLDWVQAYQKDMSPPVSSEVHQNTWLNTGTGFTPAGSDFDLPDVVHDNDGDWDYPAVRGSFVDVNGDGLKDWVRDYEGGIPNYAQKTWLSTGTGWERDDTYDVPFVHKDHSNVRHSRFNWPVNITGFYLDVNRDGLVDFVETFKDVDGNDQKTTWLNNGGDCTTPSCNWETSSAIDADYNTGWVFFDYSGLSNPKVSYGELIDINSDGSADWVQNREDLTPDSMLSNLAKTDQIEQITTTTKVEIKPSFALLTEEGDLYKKNPTSTATGHTFAAEADSVVFIAPTYVTSKLETSRPDQDTGVNTTTYRYGGAQVHRKGRGYLGFYLFESTNQLGITSSTEFYQAYPFTGRVRKAMSTQNSVVLSQVENTYLAQTITHPGTSATTVFAALEESNSELRELNSGAITRKTMRELVYDNYGNITLDRTTTGSASVVNLNETQVDTVYKPADTTTWFVNQVDNVKVDTRKEGLDLKTRKTKFTYSDEGDIETIHRQWDDPILSNRLHTKYEYDAYGNLEYQRVKSDEFANDERVDSFTYDADHRLPLSFTNAAGHQSSIPQLDGYDTNCDLPKKVLDINNLETQIVYDDFCRQVSTTDPTTIVSTVTYEVLPTDCGSACQTTPALKIVSTTTGLQDIITYVNKFGQGLVSSTLSVDNEKIEQRSDYNRFGLTDSESEPYFFGIGDPTYDTTYLYDEINRLKKVLLPYTPEEDPVEIDYTYDTGSLDDLDLQVRTQTDPAGKTTQTFVNALGQIEKVVDADSKPLKFTYDSQGNLKNTLDAANNPIVVGYDILGRRTSLDDPDMGLSTFTYTSFGELETQKDNKDQLISMEYDALSRLVKRHVPMVNGSNGGHTKWNYDTALNGIGAVHEILSHLSDVNDDTTAIHKVEYGYDNKSRLDARTTSFNGLDYTEGFSYNASNGFLASRQYPSSGDTSAYPFEVKYNYTNGYLQSITSDTESAGQCVEHYSINEYDAQGRVTEETLGRLVNTHRSFKGGKGVLEGIQSTLILGAQTGVMVQDLSYIYDAVNNVDSRTDNNTGIYERFEYDDLHRLTKFFKTDPDPNVNGGSEALITQVDYDEIGNITRKSDVGTYQYETNGNLPHAVKRVVSPFPTSAELTKFDVSWEWNDELESASAPGADIRDQDFTYDLNGNILKSGNREFGWTSFDKPERMVRGNITSGYTGATFLYDGQFNRIQKQEATFNALQNIGVPKETTFYIGKDYEKISNANETEILHRYSINVGGSVIQVEREHNTDFDQPKYLLADNLGSTNVIVDQLGADVQTLSFDPWGMRVNSDGGTVNGITNRGFTGHEMDDEVGLVNMNARIYDPYLGRFLSADPLLPDPYDMQSFNRYSYVRNNPLKYIDPTGNLEEHVDGGSGQKPSEMIEEIVVTAGQITPVANGATTIGSVDISVGGSGGPPLYFNRKTGRVGTEEELWGDEEALRAEAENLADLQDAANDKNAGQGRLSTQARDDAREEYDQRRAVYNPMAAQVNDAILQKVLEILNSAIMMQAFELAWQESNPNAPSVKAGDLGSKKVEQGGWVIKTKNGFRLKRWKPGTRSVSRPGFWKPFRTAASFHTHPNTSAESYSQDPSPSDIKFANRTNVPLIIRGHNGYRYIFPEN